MITWPWKKKEHQRNQDTEYRQRTQDRLDFVEARLRAVQAAVERGKDGDSHKH